MTFSVIIPVRDVEMYKEETGLDDLVKYFMDRKILVVLTVNGPDAKNIIPIGRSSRYLSEIYGGSSYNPYPARNIGLKYLFGLPETDAVFLIDSDCYPEEGFFEELCLQAKPENLVAGRTTTKVPHGSKHFDLLRDRFECYDGFTPPDHTVGCNMLIGRKVYEAVGPLRADKVSGGDGIYVIEWKKLGGSVIPAPRMHVKKTINGMTLKGIVLKQISRACCYPSEMMAPIDETLESLRDDLFKMASVSFDQETLEYYYPQFVDCIFKISMRIGMLSQHLDLCTDNTKESSNELGSKLPNPDQG